MRLIPHLIYIYCKATDGSFHGFFRRVSAPTVAEALIIAQRHNPGYVCEPFDEKEFVS